MLSLLIVPSKFLFSVVEPYLLHLHPKQPAPILLLLYVFFLYISIVQKVLPSIEQRRKK